MYVFIVSILLLIICLQNIIKVRIVHGRENFLQAYFVKYFPIKHCILFPSKAGHYILLLHAIIIIIYYCDYCLIQLINIYYNFYHRYLNYLISQIVSS